MSNDTPTLESIREAARKADACEAEFNPFTDAIDRGDTLTAWQTVLGNREWLLRRVIALPHNLEELAEHVGKSWHSNGQLYKQCTCQDGKLHGNYKEWYDNGQLVAQCTYQDGKLHGNYKEWYDNGQLVAQCTYVNGIIQ